MIFDSISSKWKPHQSPRQSSSRLTSLLLSISASACSVILATMFLTCGLMASTRLWSYGVKVTTSSCATLPDWPWPGPTIFFSLSLSSCSLICSRAAAYRSLTTSRSSCSCYCNSSCDLVKKLSFRNEYFSKTGAPFGLAKQLSWQSTKLNFVACYVYSSWTSLNLSAVPNVVGTLLSGTCSLNDG